VTCSLEENMRKSYVKMDKGLLCQTNNFLHISLLKKFKLQPGGLSVRNDTYS
jgi:hypothetical protein